MYNRISYDACIRIHSQRDKHTYTCGATPAHAPHVSEHFVSQCATSVFCASVYDSGAPAIELRSRRERSEFD